MRLGRCQVASPLLLLFLMACASFDPQPIQELRFQERAQTQTRDGITVTTAVLSRDEAKQAFGVDLASQQIQPVWFEIQNDSGLPYAFMLTGVDPNYFSAHEAAYMSHLFWRPRTNRKMDDLFDAHALNPDLPPNSHRSGFVFTSLKLGTKEVRVRLFGPARKEEFEFFVAGSGFRADYNEVDWDVLLAQDFVNYDDEDALEEALRQLPCCTSRQNGTGAGDPVNLIIVGSHSEVANALARGGWDETEALTAGSAWRTFKAFFGGGEYKYSPMSSLYIYGRAQDAGFQKARDTIHERNHLRLWLSPMKFRGDHVWVGTITRDIGIYFTSQTWNLTSHAIDPYVDEARGNLIEDFINAQSVERFGYVDGVGATTKDAPQRNLMNSPWWTDGDRLVVEISKTPVPLERVDFFYWGWTDQEEQIKRLRHEAR